MVYGIEMKHVENVHKKGEVKKIALIGPNVKERVISGGGSAALKASYIVTPFAGLVDNAPEGFELKHEIGCYCEQLVTLRRAHGPHAGLCSA